MKREERMEGRMKIRKYGVKNGHNGRRVRKEGRK